MTAFENIYAEKTLKAFLNAKCYELQNANVISRNYLLFKFITLHVLIKLTKYH